MKKTFLLIGGILLALTGVAAIDWSSNSIENLAKGATAIVSSKDNEAKNITDGNAGSRWQAQSGYNSSYNDWVIVDLGDITEFTDIEIKWEASYASAYSLYFSDEEIPYEYPTEDNTGTNRIIDEDWLTSHQPVAEGGNLDSDLVENFTFEEGTSTRYILVYCTEYSTNAKNYGSSIHEIYVANIPDKDEVASLKLDDISFTAKYGASINVRPVNSISEELPLDKISDLSLTCDDENVKITPEGNGAFYITCDKSGSYVLNAKAVADGKDVVGSCKLTVNYDWTIPVNIAAHKETSARVAENTDDNNPAGNAVDVNEDTYYQYNGPSGGGEAWVIVDLGVESVISAIGVKYGSDSNGSLKFYYASESNEPQMPTGDEKWSSSLTGWTETPTISRSSNAVSTYEFDEPTTVRYIAVSDVSNTGAAKPKVCEILVAGTEIKNPIATEITLKVEPGMIFIGENANVECIVKDQYGTTFVTSSDPIITVTGADYDNGIITATDKGVISIKAEYETLSAEISIRAITEDDYCMTYAEITSDTNYSDGSKAIDGGKERDKEGELYIVVNNDQEAAGEHEHYILADLKRPYNLDMIIALWEGACPRDYDVYVGKSADNLTKLYSITGHNQNAWKDRFFGESMDDIQFIKIVTKYNATQYGIKLFDLKAYGTSDIESIPTSIEITSNINHVATGEKIILSGTVLSQFGEAMPDAPISYFYGESKLENNEFIAEDKGNYTIKAKSGELEEEFIIYVDAESDKKFTNEILNSVTLNGESLDKNPFIKDEIQIPLSQLGQELIIDFGENYYSFTLLSLNWEAACPSDYTVKATYSDGSTAEILRVEGRAFEGGVNPSDRIWNNPTPTESTKMRANAMQGSSLSNIKKLTILPTAVSGHNHTLRLLSIDAYDSGDVVTSISPKIVSDEFASTQYYTVQGVKVANPQKGLYIKVEGGKATKVLIR